MPILLWKALDALFKGKLWPFFPGPVGGIFGATLCPFCFGTFIWRFKGKLWPYLYGTDALEKHPHTRPPWQIQLEARCPISKYDNWYFDLGLMPMALLEKYFWGIRQMKNPTRGEMPKNEKSNSRRDAQTQNSKTDILILGSPAHGCVRNRFSVYPGN